MLKGKRLVVGRPLALYEKGFASWMTTIVHVEKLVDICCYLAQLGIAPVAMSFDNPRRLWFRNETQFHLATTLLRDELKVHQSPSRDIGTHMTSVQGTHIDVQALCRLLSSKCHITAISPFGDFQTKKIYYTKKS